MYNVQCHTEGKRLIAMIAEEDHSYFTLPPLPSQRPQIGLLYGVSCFRQVHVSVRAHDSSLLFICVGPAPALPSSLSLFVCALQSLHVNSEAYTRTLVQKTVCALTNVVRFPPVVSSSRHLLAMVVSVDPLFAWLTRAHTAPAGLHSSSP